MNWIQRRKPLARSGISRSKYGNKKQVDTAGRSFGSGLERSVFAMLELRVKVGELRSIRQQATVYLTAARIRFIPDFEVEDKDGEKFFVEAKGLETPEYRLKRRLWTVYGPARLEVWKGTATRPYLHETIYPKSVYQEAE